ncbi:hypothetical protein P3T36_006910 [Kitasatospora sp. MAP12-15]|uniref:hypothetical protein n=1 Tax=unclassified Kitasatospora TaxID=2633591 RepID=UPI0024750225|nr:hypothetical protein [Kitasatospora sp. MAP12-44]MDH6111907.1 hypothetical protein [Kitasatospora sp. MAP12-44]
MPYYVLVTGSRSPLRGAIITEARHRLWRVGTLDHTPGGITVIQPEGGSDGLLWDAVIDTGTQGADIEARKYVPVSEDVGDIKAAAVEACDRAASRTSTALRRLGIGRLLHG